MRTEVTYKEFKCHGVVWRIFKFAGLWRYIGPSRNMQTGTPNLKSTKEYIKDYGWNVNYQ